jgi:hypothetical protein
VVRVLREPKAADCIVPAATWPSIARTADRLGIAPLLHHKLRHAGTHTLLPPEPAAFLKEAHQRSLVRNLRLYAELAEVLAALSRRGVEALILKGAHLAAAVYADPGARLIRDLDLLVHREALPAAVAALEALGYRSPVGSLQLKVTSHHLPRFMRAGRTAIELHWRLSMDSDDPPGLWERAIQVAAPGINARVLGPTDLLLHLALHAARSHRCHMGLRPWHDMALTMQHYAAALDWDLLVRSCRGQDAARPAALAFLLAHDLAGAEPPATLEHRLVAEPVPSGVVAFARARSLTEPTMRSSFSEHAMAFAAGSLRTRLRAGLARLFPPPPPAAGTRTGRTASWHLLVAYARRARDLLLGYGGLLLGPLGLGRQRRQDLAAEMTLASWLSGR